VKKIIFAEVLSWRNTCRVASHEYAARFANAGCKVCWISHPLSPLHLLKQKYLRLFIKEIAGKTAAVKDGSSGLFSFRPFTFIPYTHVRFLDGFNFCMNSLNYTYPKLSSVLRKKEFGKVDLLWLTNIHLAGLVNMVEYRKLVLRLADNLTAFPGAPDSSEQVLRFLIDRADIVFCASQRLTAVLTERYKGRFIFLPNGVNFEKFTRAAEFEPPVEYRDIEKPIVVYSGAISKWFDVELMHYLCKNLPDLHFFLIGPIDINLQKLQGLDNVSILGFKPYHELPAYLVHADIGIIPFKKNALTDFIHPIKLYEYCAAGLGVVSTNLKETRAMTSPALIVDSYQEFKEALQHLAENPLNPETAVAFAERNSWDRRFQKIIELVGADV